MTFTEHVHKYILKLAHKRDPEAEPHARIIVRYAHQTSDGASIEGTRVAMDSYYQQKCAEALSAQRREHLDQHLGISRSCTAPTSFVERISMGIE